MEDLVQTLKNNTEFLKDEFSIGARLLQAAKSSNGKMIWLI